MAVSTLLASHADVRPTPHEHPPVDPLTATILAHLDEQTVITLDLLVSLMPEYRWSEIFHCVDHLARHNKLVLRQHHFAYTLFSPTFLA